MAYGQATSASDWWADDPCPTWCAEIHASDDHGADCQHVSAWTVVPVVVHDPDFHASPPRYGEAASVPGELVIGVRRWRGDRRAWLTTEVGDADIMRGQRVEVGVGPPVLPR